MSVAHERKADVIGKFRLHDTDSGSTEVQIALLTDRINVLSEHLKENKKDVHSRFGLIKMVGRRKRLLSYLQSESEERYKQVLADLNLRK